MASEAVFGDWTHRRRDAGGTRSLAADVSRFKPEVTWSWAPSDGAFVNQVRIASGLVYVATIPREVEDDSQHAGWSHAVLYALDVVTGREVSRRLLPDPVPVAAMAIEQGVVHLVATRKGEPIFIYELEVGTLAPKSRRRVTLDRDELREDILDTWVMADGGMWLEVEGPVGSARVYASVADGARTAVTQVHASDIATPAWGQPARDACSDGHKLYAPLNGGGSTTTFVNEAPPALWEMIPRLPPEESAADLNLAPPALEPWARFNVAGPRQQAHTLTAEGAVGAVAVAIDSERFDRAFMQAMAVDRLSGVVRWSTPVAGIPLRGAFGDTARLARRTNGEMLFQRMASDGTPCTDVVRIRPDGSHDVLALGTGKRFVLDAAMGKAVLAHHECFDGRVTVAAFAVEREGRILGRIAGHWGDVETPDLGGGANVYAGAGHIVVRGNAALAGVRV